MEVSEEELERRVEPSGAETSLLSVDQALEVFFDTLHDYCT